MVADTLEFRIGESWGFKNQLLSYVLNSFQKSRVSINKLEVVPTEPTSGLSAERVSAKTGFTPFNSREDRLPMSQYHGTQINLYEPRFGARTY